MGLFRSALSEVLARRSTGTLCHLARHPRMVEPVVQLFGEPVSMHQFKINGKMAFEGDVWQWHQAALHDARTLGYPVTLAFVLLWSVVLDHFCRATDAMQDHLAALLTLTREQKFTQRIRIGGTLQGWLDATQRRQNTAPTQIQQSLAVYRTIGFESERPYYMALLAEAASLANKTGEQFYQAELYRLQGGFALQ